MRRGGWLGLVLAVTGCGDGLGAYKDATLMVMALPDHFSVTLVSPQRTRLKGSVVATVDGKKMKRDESGGVPTVRTNTPDWSPAIFSLEAPHADKSGRTVFRLADGKDVIEVEVSGFDSLDVLELVSPASLDGVGDKDEIVLRLRTNLAKWWPNPVNVVDDASMLVGTEDKIVHRFIPKVQGNEVRLTSWVDATNDDREAMKRPGARLQVRASVDPVLRCQGVKVCDGRVVVNWQRPMRFR